MVLSTQVSLKIFIGLIKKNERDIIIMERCKETNEFCTNSAETGKDFCLHHSTCYTYDADGTNRCNLPRFLKSDQTVSKFCEMHYELGGEEYHTYLYDLKEDIKCRDLTDMQCFKKNPRTCLQTHKLLKQCYNLNNCNIRTFISS